MRIFFLLGFVLFGLAISSSVHAQLSSPIALSGYAWSSNIGWISFSGPGYGVTIETNGDVTGYAWSSNIGWIKFGGLSVFPGSPDWFAIGYGGPSYGPGNNAYIDFTTNELAGWARACTGTENGDCSTMTNHIDGWDGWISLNCSNTGSCATNNYAGSAVGGVFSGYVWGSDVIGWVNLSGSGYGVSYTPPCAPSLQCSVDALSVESIDQWCQVATVQDCSASGLVCSGGSCVADNPTGSITLTPPVVRTGGTTEVSWTSTGATSCTLEQQNAAGNAYQTWTGTVGTNQTSNPINNFTVFSLQCTASGNPALEQEIASTTIRIIPTQVET